jgi:hypothetical protein
MKREHIGKVRPILRPNSEIESILRIIGRRSLQVIFQRH